MAMNAGRLAAAIYGRLFTAWRSEPPSNQAQNEDYFLTLFATIIAEEVVSEITGNAKCSGLDSHSDTHDNVGIV